MCVKILRRRSPCLDVGHRLAAALIEGPLVSLAYAVSDEARLELEETVRRIWRRHFTK